ncbi:MAG: hypothetical protein QXP36_11995, partial [Conexivisphaerales archaeon]
MRLSDLADRAKEKLSPRELAAIAKSTAASIKEEYAPEVTRENIISGLATGLIGPLGMTMGSLTSKVSDNYKTLGSRFDRLTRETKRQTSILKSINKSQDDLTDALTLTGKKFERSSKNIESGVNLLRKSNENIAKEHKSYTRELTGYVKKAVKYLSIAAIGYKFVGKPLVKLVQLEGFQDKLESKIFSRLGMLSGSRNSFNQLASNIALLAKTVFDIKSGNINNISNIKTEPSTINPNLSVKEQVENTFKKVKNLAASPHALANTILDKISSPLAVKFLNLVSPELANFSKVIGGNASAIRTFTQLTGPQWMKNIMYSMDRIRVATSALGKFASAYQDEKRVQTKILNVIKLGTEQINELRDIAKNNPESLLAKGYSNKEIRLIQNLSPEDIEQYKRKLDIENRKRAMSYRERFETAYLFKNALKARESGNETITLGNKTYKVEDVLSKGYDIGLSKDSFLLGKGYQVTNFINKAIGKVLGQTEEEIREMEKLRQRIFSGMSGVIRESYLMFKAPAAGLAVALASGAYGKAAWFAMAKVFPKTTKTLWVIYKVFQGALKLSWGFVKSVFKTISFTVKFMTHPLKTLDDMGKKLSKTFNTVKSKTKTAIDTLKFVSDMVYTPLSALAGGVLQFTGGITKAISRVHSTYAKARYARKVNLEQPPVNATAFELLSFYTFKRSIKLLESIKKNTGSIADISLKTWAITKAKQAWEFIKDIGGGVAKGADRLLSSSIGKLGIVPGLAISGFLSYKSIISEYKNIFDRTEKAGASPMIAKLVAGLASTVESG